MDNALKEIVWNQFGASIDMLISTIKNCPDDYFETNTRFYYIAFHATLFLDYYLTEFELSKWQLLLLIQLHRL